LADQGVSLDLVYNRGSLMMVPPGISKGTGVRQAMQVLGLSFQDVLALGDAENDLALFEACGWAACPGNGVQELKDRADWVFPGENGRAIARAIVGPILGDRLSVAGSARHRVPIGWTAQTSEAATVSWLAGAFVERLVNRRYSVCVIDPEGDYGVLGAFPGVSSVEVRDEAEWRRALERLDYDTSASIVLDLSGLDHITKSVLIEAGLSLTHERRRRSGLPHWVVLDEAHYWGGPRGLDDMGLNSKGFCLVTYRASALADSVWKAIDLLLIGHTTPATELDRLRAVFAHSPTRDLVSILPTIPGGEFLLVERDCESRALTFVAMPRTTSHVRHLGKYADGRLPAHRCHAARGDFSRWLREVFADRELGGQLAKLERRWSRQEVYDLRRDLIRLIAAAIEQPS
jgi:hypothetical protein